MNFCGTFHPLHSLLLFILELPLSLEPNGHLEVVQEHVVRDSLVCTCCGDTVLSALVCNRLALHFLPLPYA